MAAPKIVLYTNRACPWAHRAHIALRESGLQYEEVTIDLSKPREPWYLQVNPRGVVPSLSYNGQIITESAIVAQFIADAHPSHLLPPSNTVEGALFRARVAFFVDTFFTKVNPKYINAIRSPTEQERDEATRTLVQVIVKEIEPLLSASTPEGGKGPFFGGSGKLTLVEVLTGSFLLRILAFHKPEYGLLSADLPAQLECHAPLFKRWAEATVQQESVNFIWDEKGVGERTKARMDALKKQL